MLKFGYELFDHKADMGLRGYGSTPAEAFEQAGIAFTAIMTDPAMVDEQLEYTFTCQAPDLDFLFYEWINGLVYTLATEKLIFSRFQITIKDTTLQAKAWGETIDSQKHEPAVEIKAATFTELKVYQCYNKRWIAQCVVDV
jgi:tRNA nucleotidyltransferase (CCA-adding enzyme)